MGEDKVDIVCPDCGGRCVFEEPFEFLETPPPGESRQAYRWADRIVLEKFPREFPWTEPLGGYPLMRHGLARCAACGLRRRHELNWPADAYWCWDIRGRMLWARDRAHALEILEHVRLEHRPARTSPGLKRLPGFFLTAANRELVLSKIEKSLAARDTRSS